MASVLPRVLKSGAVRYRVQFRINGQPREDGFDNADAAVAYAELVEKVGGAEARRIRDLRSSRGDKIWNLREWTEHFLAAENGHIGGVTERTLYDYADIAGRSFLQLLGELPLDAIQKKDVRKWVRWQEAQIGERSGVPLAAKTVANYHGVLSTVMAGAVQEGLIEKNPAYGVELTEGTSREGLFLNEREFGVIYRFVHEHFQPLVLFLAMTGCRWGEASAIRWGDLDLEATPPTIRIQRAWKRVRGGKFILGPPKTKKGRRTLPLPEGLIAALGEPGNHDELVFKGIQGTGRVWYAAFSDRVWRPAIEAARDEARTRPLGLEPVKKHPRIHDLRHTHASWLIQNGISLPVISARMGHENITTTMSIYGHLAPDDLNRTAAVMNGVLSRTTLQLP